ncbi:Uncharacterised protein g11216 [Pycnogonum litorale]
MKSPISAFMSCMIVLTFTELGNKYCLAKKCPPSEENPPCDCYAMSTKTLSVSCEMVQDFNQLRPRLVNYLKKQAIFLYLPDLKMKHINKNFVSGLNVKMLGIHKSDVETMDENSLTENANSLRAVTFLKSKLKKIFNPAFKSLKLTDIHITMTENQLDSVTATKSKLTNLPSTLE